MRITPHSFLRGTLILVLLATTASEGMAEPTAFYVAPNGNDAWSGTLAEPNASGDDGPFATPQAARDAIRRLKKTGPLPDGGVVVELRGGVYRWQKTFTLSAEDAGALDTPIVYRARPGETVRISGGRVVSGFKPVTDQQVLARLDEAAREKVRQADLRALGVTDFGPVKGGGVELFFQNQPMTLARWPNEGFVKITGLVEPDTVNVRGTKGSKTGKFMYEGNRPRRWIGEKDAWVHGYWFWDWSDQRHPIQSIDPEKRILAVKPPYHHYGYRVGQWFYGLNILAELDAPGEWYLDREKGILYFWPPAPLAEAETVISVAESLVSMEDVSHVTLEGLTFECARGTAVVVRGGEHVKLAGCVLRNLGQAVKITNGKKHGVLACEMYHLADGGITLIGGDRRTLTPAGHEALDNHIHHYGRWNRMYRSGISLYGVGFRVAHNLIHSAPHMGIFFDGNNHVIELNEIHHVCEESNDAGAIYAGRDWTMRGTVIRHNFFHHISGFQKRGCVGVYLDDMFSGTTISGNVFYKVTRAAMIGGGRDNVVENNLFVDCTPAMHLDCRGLGWAKPSVGTTMTKRLEAMPYQKPPWSEQYPELVDILKQTPGAPEGNRIVGNVAVGGRWSAISPQAAQYSTIENNWIDADIVFPGAEKLDFQIPDDSPIYEKIPDFQKIPFREIGPRPKTPLGMMKIQLLPLATNRRHP